VEELETGDSEMSDDEVEEIGQSLTANDELRLFGMHGDDEEDLCVYFVFSFCVVTLKIIIFVNSVSLGHNSLPAGAQMLWLQSV
jgi:hypothetical protein